MQGKDTELLQVWKRAPAFRVHSLYRYGNVVKRQLQHVETVKKKMQGLRDDFDEELKKKTREEVVRAMGAELGGMSTGHWFVCPNGYVSMPSRIKRYNMCSFQASLCYR